MFRMNRLFAFFLLLFFEGVAGTTYQVLFIRQFSSSIGNNAEFTGIIICVFLGAMSLGYKIGGRDNDTPLKTLGLNFLIMSGFGGVMASSSISGAFLTNPLIESSHLRLFVYSIFSVGLTAYFVAQSLPLLLQYKQDGESPASQSGNALFISTIGSMIGAGLPLPLLAPLIGASATLSFLCISSTAVGCALLLKYRLTPFGAFAIFFAILGVVAPVTPYIKSHVDGSAFTSTTYNDVYLRDNDDVLIMEMNNARMSMRFKSGGSASSYVHYINHQLKLLGKTNKNVLVLGAGGFQIHEDDKDNHYTYVDIDSELLDWAGSYFGVNKEEVNLVAKDARAFLVENRSKWDVIVLDVFSSADSIPAHLMTLEFFSLVKSRIGPDGLFIANTVTSGGFRDKLSQKLYNTIHASFPFCQVQQTLAGNETQLNNVVYTCFSHGSDKGLYRDDKRARHSDFTKT